jgi:hypothetical protein
MHLAMHDAVNAVAPFYHFYAFDDREQPQLQESDEPSVLRGRELRAHPIAAAAQAAHDVLVSQVPGQQARLDRVLSDSLSAVSDGRLKARGIELGQRAAAAVLAKRNGDGWDVQGSYEFKAGIGDYQTTPPWKGFVLQPGFAKARPFGMASTDRWRPAPPPAIDSQQYADAFNEVKTYGRLDSARRTPDQTAYAVWWMEFELGSMNRLAGTLVRQRGLHLWQTARLFALLHMSIADGGVATWDAKFHYNHWRPYTAVRRAADDRNPGTEADAQWEALRPTPPFPEYPSGHAMGCGTSFEIFTSTFDDGTPFTMESATAPPGMPTRSFTSFSQADAECSDSRVMLGFHYRYAAEAGRKLGHLVARDIVDHHLRPRRMSAGDRNDGTHPHPRPWLLVARARQGIEFNEITANLDVRRGIDIGFVKRSNLAFGVEYRRDIYEIEAGEQASYPDAESM